MTTSDVRCFNAKSSPRSRVTRQCSRIRVSASWLISNCVGGGVRDMSAVPASDAIWVASPVKFETKALQFAQERNKLQVSTETQRLQPPPSNLNVASGWLGRRVTKLVRVARTKLSSNRRYFSNSCSQQQQPYEKSCGVAAHASTATTYLRYVIHPQGHVGMC